ncbi:MAG: winged helix-turn-helix domain-containing protein, partial [Candidatus Acidiferrales bacterium]
HKADPMVPPNRPLQGVRFGDFEADLRSGELRRRGLKVKLADQSFKILSLLLERAGEVVTREELRQKLWSEDTFVDFEAGLNSAIKRLRDALGDSADEPRFIETLPRRGYRFLALVERESKPRDSPPIESLAVLPLENLTGDASQEYFVDGMTEALISTLAHISALRVISRTSTMSYKNVQKPLPTIGRELNVDGVVEGAVVRSGNHVRITVQLVHAPTDRHLWASEYEGKLEDILLLQSEVARAVAAEIQVRLAPQEHARLAQNRAVNPEAYDAYLKGCYLWNKRTEVEMTKAIECFRQAVEKDPREARAWAGMADCYNLLGATVYAALPPSEAYPRAKEAALKALEIDETLAQPHTSLAWTNFAFYWDWPSAEKGFRRSLELNPGYATGHHWYAFYLISQGRTEEAITEIKRAQELDPLSLIINTNVGIILYFAREYDEAIRQLRSTLEMDPNFVSAHWGLAWPYGQKGMYEEAIAELTVAIRLAGDSPIFSAMLGHIYALAGKRAEAQKAIDRLSELSAQRYVSPFEIALVYIGLGENEGAFEWLEKAYHERSFWLVLLEVEPKFDPLRSDLRFQDLVRRLGLPADG